jgi:hypothetical protein
MRRILILMLPLAAAAVALGQDKPATPAEQYKALRKEYDKAPGKFPENDAERLVYVGNVYKHHFVVARKFLALAEKYPDDPIAFDALNQAVWQVNNTPWPVELVGEDAARSRAFELLQRDHLRSDKLGPLCQRISYGFCKEYVPTDSASLHSDRQRIVSFSAFRADSAWLGFVSPGALSRDSR